MHRLAFILAMFGCGAAHAGAWLQDKGHWQIIASFEASRANAGFDAKGRADPTVKFDKLYMKTLVEYGWSDRMTVFVAPQYVIAASRPSRYAPVTELRDGAIEIGTRLRLFHTFGIASFESSYTSAGPSDLSNSRRLDSAQVSEMRLLYGTNYRLLGRDGFSTSRWENASSRARVPTRPCSTRPRGCGSAPRTF